MAANLITKNFCMKIFPKCARKPQFLYQINAQCVLNNNHVIGCSGKSDEVPAMRTVKTIVLHKDIIKEQQEETLCEGHVEGHWNETTQDYGDMPIPNMPNPYERPAKKCLLCEHKLDLDYKVLCEHKLDLDYKNNRLLSQFVSPYTGEIYGRHVNGLCIYMQRRVAKLIKRARYFGLMPYTAKEPKYLRDPKLFDPFKRR